jgi:small-conductance mechanosensitive channel
MALLALWSEAQGWINLVVSAVIILLIGLIIGKVLGRIAQRGLREVELNRILKKAGINFGMEEFIGHAIAYLVYFITLVLALDQLGVTAFVLYIIVAVILIIVAVAFILSIKDFIPNFIAGIRLNYKKPYATGDTITVGSVSGKVKEIGLLETKLANKSGDVIHIPNSNIIRQEIKVRKK